MLGLMLMMTIVGADPPPTPPPETVCKVEVSGIPASVRPEHELIWPGGRAAADEVVDVRFRGRETGVMLRGPRYEGSVHLSASTCGSGARRIDARPRPASIRFRCAPPGLVVRCDRCPGVSKRWVTAPKFPSLPMDGYIREVSFEFKAAGFRAATRRLIVYPGVNLVDVHLEKL
jgi:hypothetical protein